MVCVLHANTADNDVMCDTIQKNPQHILTTNCSSYNILKGMNFVDPSLSCAAITMEMQSKETYNVYKCIYIVCVYVCMCVSASAFLYSWFVCAVASDC